MFKYFFTAFLIVQSVGAEPSKIVVAIPNKIMTLDPQHTVIAQDRFVLPLLFEYLVEADPYGEIVNRLISSWEFFESRKVLRLHLSRDRKFSDGSTLQAADVVGTFRTLCGAHSEAASQFIGLNGCSDRTGSPKVVAVDSETIDFTISIHANAFLYQLAYGRAPIFKTSVRGDVLGSGPYVVRRIKDGNATLIRNPYSFRGGSFDEIEFQFFSEESIRRSITSGRFDVAAMYLQPFVESLESKLYKQVVHAPSITHALVLNPTRPTFADQRFRAEFRDRIQSSKIAQCRKGIPGTGLIPLGIPGSGLEKEGPRNLKGVKRRPQAVTLFRHINRKNECEEGIVKDIGVQMGLQIEFRHLADYLELIKKYRSTSTDGYMELIPFVSRDPASILRRFIPNSTENYYFFESPSIEADLKKALSKRSISDRGEIYRKLNLELYHHAGLIPISYIGHAALIKKCLHLKSIDMTTYNPNSFLYLLDIEKFKGC